AIQGKAALVRAEVLVSEQKLDLARAQLLRARSKFQATRREMASATRFLPFVRDLPVVRTQIRGVETLAEAGLVLTDAGISLSDAASVIVEPRDNSPSLSNALSELRTIRGLLATGLTSIDAAAATVDQLEGAFLPGPVGRARSQFRQRLPEIRQRAADSEEALAAMITFVGGNGPRSYLFLSQNPDEVRPTGGFIGTYGVVTGTGGKLAIDRFEPIESWILGHPDAIATPEELAGPFRHDRRLSQRIANANAVPDWPQSAELAARLWARGEEEPVDGVISFTPAFLARILLVTGPVQVAEYSEVVTAQNLIERLDFYTHQQPALGADRKDFIAVLARVVMDRLLGAPTSQWAALGKVVGDAFEAREAMAWSTDPEVASVLAERRWDSAMPAVAGDFVYPAEFEYSAKNGRALRRTYRHHVQLHPDGSGTVTTSVRIVNGDPPDRNSNPANGLDFITMYGPQGATLGGGSDPLGIIEPPLAGHPAVAWFRPLEPQSETSVTVAWNVPQLIRRLPDGNWEYSLLWMRHPDHTGDVLQLTFELPRGWEWDGTPPPGEVALVADVSGKWVLAED
ncbi:MAG TPA: DUF4012 domain-containing protein, partial [Acidimicrobiales bacterium]